jgi:hypothetical protein
MLVLKVHFQGDTFTVDQRETGFLFRQISENNELVNVTLYGTLSEATNNVFENVKSWVADVEAGLTEVGSAIA